MIELDKREEIIKLFDTYSSLLTDKQKMYFEAYYYDDFSLSEIAQNYGVSRNAVFDQIKKTVSILNKYENNIHQVKHLFMLEECLKLDNIDQIKELISKIIEE